MSSALKQLTQELKASIEGIKHKTISAEDVTTIYEFTNYLHVLVGALKMAHKEVLSSEKI